MGSNSLRVRERKEQAQRRAELCLRRGPAGQLRELDLRLGVDVGAKRERAKLIDRILKAGQRALQGAEA